MKVCKRLLEIGCYYELEIYIKNHNANNNNDFLNEIYELRNDLLEKFIKEKSFYKWRTICRILEMMYKMKRNGEIRVLNICEGGSSKEEGGSSKEEGGSSNEEGGSKVEGGSKEEGRSKEEEGGSKEQGDDQDNEGDKESLKDNEGVDGKEHDNGEYKMKIVANGEYSNHNQDLPIEQSLNHLNLSLNHLNLSLNHLNLSIHCPLKFKFYIRLLCIPLDFSLPLIFKSNLYLKFINLFLDNPDDSFYSNSLFNFFKISLGNPDYKNLLEKGGFIKGIEKIMLRNLSELYGGRPKTEASFIYCIYLLNEIPNNPYYDLVNLIMTGDSLKYNDDLKIDEYLDNFLNDIIIRFTCNLVIDRMPVLSAFLSKEEHADSKVEGAESKEEKRVRLGGGMQDTL
uniref:Ribosome maturation protein SBDS n=1 Tax=Nosema pernyi TaxID=1112939 RepID=X5EPB2_9MICR|nr:ribosome maturation protein SBDS [Nosema pernyi]